MTIRSTRKITLMHSCAGAALLASLMFASQGAAAQGINGTGTVVQGSAQIDDMVPGTTRVTVDTMDTVIDWQPTLDPFTGNALTFLPQNNLAIFENGTNNANFAVLNRIIPDAANNPALFEGIVQAFLNDQLTGARSPGGFVAFYSPSGIIVGPTGRFEVPQLVLTTQAVDISTISAFANGTGQMFLSGNSGAIDIQSGAVLTGAPGTGGPEDSFLVVASPSITMAGDAYYNGSIAYVASNTMFISHQSGLFDIIITGGVGGGQVITHSGSSGGPSSTGAGDEHVIYGVTQGAIGGGGVSMLFSGNLGFDPAASATVVNGDIILSANYNVFGRNVDGDDNRQGADSFFDGRNQVPGVQGDILLENIDATSNFLAIASDLVNLTALGSSSSFTADLSLVGRAQAVINADDGGSVIVGGDLFVSARNYGIITQSLFGIDATGGFASVRAGFDSLVSVSGETMVAASALPGFNFGTNTAGTGTGGQTQILSQGGTIDLQGNVRMESYAQFIPGGSFPPSGYGAMQGGQVQFLATEAGFLSTQGSLTVDASAEGPQFSAIDASLAGDVNGGSVLIGTGTGGGSVSIAGNVSASVDGELLEQNFTTGAGPVATGGSVNIGVTDFGTLDIGGNVNGTARANIAAVTGGGSAGDAFAGSAGIGAVSGDINITGTLELIATAQGGNGETGGDARGGDTTIVVDNGDVSLGGLIFLEAEGFGGNATGAGDGGSGSGGNTSIAVTGGTLTGGLTFAQAEGLGGIGATGGDGSGGVVDLSIENGGTWNAGGIIASTNGLAFPGSDGDGGIAQGGETNLFLGSSGTLDLTGNLELSSSARPRNLATDGTPPDPTTNGNGVTAIGGTVVVTVDNATLAGATATLTMFANATGGAVNTAGFTGGSASGGGTSLSIQNGGSVSVASMAIEARGEGGDGVDGASGGDGAGGTIDVLVGGAGSSLATTGNVNLTTRVDGGDTTAAGVAGGTADGGIITVTVSDGSADIGLDLDARTSALGGNGPQGGDATGGEVTFDFTNATVVIGDDYTLLADAGSGFDPSGTGSGGFAQGGSASLLIDNTVFTAANASGGLGTDAIAGGSAGAGVGGSATGGSVLVDISNGSVVNLGQDFGLYSLAVSGGSTGGDGGTGIGGDNRLLISGGSDVSLNFLTYDTTVTGNNGATGGDATGGSNLLEITNSTFNGNRLTIFGAVVTRPDNATGIGGSAIVRLSDGAVASFGETYIETLSQSVAANATNTSGSIVIETTAGGAASSATFGNTEFFNDALGGATNTAGLIQVNATNGNIAFIDLLITNLGNAANAAPSQFNADNGSITIADFLDFISYGDVLLTYANGGTIIGGTSPGALTATFDITAVDGTISLDGDDASSRNFGALTLNLTSDNILVGADTRFGGENVTLTSTNTGETAVIGGATAGGGYSLLADEAAAIDGTNLQIVLPDVVTSSLDAVMDDVTFEGSGAARFANIEIAVDGSMNVIGAVSFTSLATGDTLSLSVRDVLRLELPTGSIRLDDGSGIAGNLLLNANAFAAADSALLAVIDADPFDATIGDALLDDGGAAMASDYISADRVEITVFDYVYGQNTGANGVYGGITVGAGGLLITQSPAATDPMNVIAFGMRDDGTTQLTNNDFFFVVEFATDLSTTYLPDARFNNCIIVTQTCPVAPTPDPTTPTIDIPITNQILIEQPVTPKDITEDGALTDSQFGFDFPSLIDAPLISEDEVVREPVTSGSDSAVHALTGTALIRDQEEDDEEEEE